ncbi:MAG TPA: phospholipase D-like domain-containing protein [Ferruginibacter sp.]|nr:phospholipase D-like domain-containing protein [Ferruginibacter sp.]HMP19344.1 phospholipase D-like domain-containing protein [Ferruginibacter sp.]
MPVHSVKSTRGFTTGNTVQLVPGGQPYFDKLLQLIESATVTIHLQTYIYDDDETGMMVAEALMQAAQRKVQVYLLADGYASQGIKDSFISMLRFAGVHFRYFEPLYRSSNFYFGRRLHHKVVVADGRCALVGGVNISNRYNDMPGQPAWLDFALYTEGQAAHELCLLCMQVWRGYRKKLPASACATRPAILPPVTSEQKTTIRVRRNDWIWRKNEISNTYFEMLKTSQQHVTILCSYFLPGNAIRRQIMQAVKRGVKIRIIAAGQSDVMLAKHAERWLYDWLLRNGIELYEYQKNILHGKLAVCDDKWMTLGSYNINNISAYASVELNLDVHKPEFVQMVRQGLEKIIEEDCVQITADYHVQTKNIFKQLLRGLSYHAIRLIFYIFTFYYRRVNYP